MSAHTWIVRPPRHTPYSNAFNGWKGINWEKIKPNDTLCPVGDFTNKGPKFLNFDVKVGGVFIKCAVGTVFRRYYFDFKKIHGLRMENLDFANCGQFRSDHSTSIAFVNCTFADLAPGNEIMAQLGDGNDDWLFERCIFTRGGCGIYLKDADAKRLIVLKCKFFDIGTKDHPHQDGHGVGIKIRDGADSFGHIIQECEFNNTGEAISFWTSYNAQLHNCLTRGNTIRNVHACSTTEGHGICDSGSHSVASGRPPVGARRNMVFDHNWIADVAGDCFHSNNRDPVSVQRNTLARWGDGRKPISIKNPFGPADWSLVHGNTIIEE